MDIDEIVISDKFEHSDKGSKYFIGYKDYIIIRPLGIVLPQMSGYMKYFDNDGKNVYFKKIMMYWYITMKFGTKLKNAKHKVS